MVAPLGHDYNKKWKTPEARKAACERFCEHLRQGLSIKSFPDASDHTVRWYRENHPEDFDPEKIEDALRESLKFWEKSGRDGMLGKIEGFNATTWIYNMKNRFKEDWSDRFIQEQVGKDGGPIETKNTTTVILPDITALIERIDKIGT